MAYKCSEYTLTEKTELKPGIFSYTVLCPEVAELARPGQFVHIRVDGFTLRRPISICDIDKKNGTIRLVFEIRGNGTDKLSKTEVGEKVDMIAPLGNGFSTEIGADKKIIVVGGGIGVPPLLATAKAFGKNAVAVIGFRSEDKIILADDFKDAGVKVDLCTDDGSAGFHGLVTFPLIDELEAGKFDMIYACGPAPMLKAIINTAKLYNVPCEVSLEQRMACGVGACVGCACKINRAGREFTLRVCKDGPVFKAEEVVL